MARNERPGFHFEGFIEMPKGRKTTTEKRGKVEDILGDSVQVARDKVDGSVSGLRVNRIFVNGNRMVSMKGPRRIFEEPEL